MIDELNEIHKQVTEDPAHVPSDVIRRFWKLVGKLKRTSNPDKEAVAKASEIREVLYTKKYGGTIPLWTLVLWFIAGVVFLYLFLYAVYHNVWGGFEDLRHWTIWWTMVAFYPFGRLIAGELFGIKLNGVAMAYYIFPTLKTDYASYLTASPSNRQWYFFLSGFWTVIVTGVLGFIGYFKTEDIICLLPVTILAVAELIAMTGVFGKWGGEMHNFHRERKIIQEIAN